MKIVSSDRMRQIYVDALIRNGLDFTASKVQSKKYSREIEAALDAMAILQSELEAINEANP